MPKSQGKTRDFFLGGNTGNGFFSFYGEVVTEESKHLYILKGGPGTGKSTFIKEAGEEIRRLGLPVELIHCSSDNNSLDGMVCPSLGIAMIDGTAPHTVDPKYPGAVDEILNVGSTVCGAVPSIMANPREGQTIPSRELLSEEQWINSTGKPSRRISSPASLIKVDLPVPGPPLRI